MKQLRGGNSVGYIRRGVLYADSSSGCLRRILLRAHGVEETNHNKRTLNVFALGIYSEDLFEGTYLEGKFDYDKEKQVVVQLSDNVEFSGRSDYIVKTPECVYELKSCTSKNTYKKVFKDGVWKQDNIVQLVNYMLFWEIATGKLCYTSYCDVMDYKTLGDFTEEEVKEMARRSTKETRIFDVTFNEEGFVCVDGNLTELNIKEVLKFQSLACEVLEHELVYLDRPMQEEESMFNACYSCPARSVCDSFEKFRFSTEEFIAKCKVAFSISNND